MLVWRASRTAGILNGGIGNALRVGGNVLRVGGNERCNGVELRLVGSGL